MKHLMNALLTTTLLTLPSVFAAGDITPVSDDGDGDEIKSTVVPVTTTAVQSTRTLNHVPFGVWSAIASYLGGKNLYLFREVSTTGRDCVPMAIIAEAKVISGISTFKSFPDTKTIISLPLHSLVSEIFSHLMHENKIFETSGALTQAGIQFFEVVNNLNIPMFMPKSVFTAEALTASPHLRKLLIARAHAGDEYAQKLVARGYAEGIYGFAQDKNNLLDLANKGCTPAQDRVALGYAEGKYGFTQDPEKLLECANKGWPEAEMLVALGYVNGIYGFPKDREKLFDLANKGWKRAKYVITARYAEGTHGFTPDSAKLLELADQDWPYAKYLIAMAHADGCYGFPQGIDKLLQLAKQGCKMAQKLVVNGYAEGTHGFTKDINKILQLADQGWEDAQDFVVKGATQGIYGFTQNPILVELLKHYYAKLNKDLKNAPAPVATPAPASAAAAAAGTAALPY